MFRLKIGGVIMAGFVCVVALNGVVTTAAVLMTSAARKEATLANEVRAPAALTSLKLARSTVAAANALRGFIITGDPAQRRQWDEEWGRIDALSGEMQALSTRFTNPQNIARWAHLRTALPALRRTQAKVVAVAAAGDAAGAAQALKAEVLPVFVDVQDTLVGKDGDGGMVGSQSALMTGGLSATDKAIGQADLLLELGLATALVAGLIIAWTTARFITVPLGRLTGALREMAGGRYDVDIRGADRVDEIGAMAQAGLIFRENGVERLRLEAEAAGFQRELDRKLKETEAAFEAAGRDQKHVVEVMARNLSSLAEGDLTVRLSEDVSADYEALKRDFNAAMSSLEQTISTIASAAAEVGSGSEEIARAAEDLSRRTEQQAASLEETAAALEQITQTVNRTATGAGQASAAVAGARTDAERSGVVVREAVEAMSAIEASSNQITQIIGLIDEIAFQTNLLALNAGVEAARAGEAGKGFAVVASEVRALAQRSAEAAKDIKTLIAASARQVEDGVSLVGQAGEALSRIVEQVASIDGVVTEIAASAQEQATGLGQVNVAVGQMDQVVQQNAAMVEQATAATVSLKGEAGGLTALVNRFRVGGASTPAPAERTGASLVRDMQARVAAYGRARA